MYSTRHLQCAQSRLKHNFDATLVHNVTNNVHQVAHMYGILHVFVSFFFGDYVCSEFVRGVWVLNFAVADEHMYAMLVISDCMKPLFSHCASQHSLL